MYTLWLLDVYSSIYDVNMLNLYNFFNMKPCNLVFKFCISLRVEVTSDNDLKYCRFEIFCIYIFNVFMRR